MYHSEILLSGLIEGAHSWIIVCGLDTKLDHDYLEIVRKGDLACK